jgi:replication factor A1
LLAAKANEIGTWGANEDPRLAAQLRDVTFKTWTLRCRAKAETYNEMTRMRVTINQVQPVNYLEESKRMVGHFEF